MIAIHTPSKSDPPDVWKPTFHCCWCGSEFVQIDLFKRRPWACPTERCQARQRRWMILDAAGVLLYLPMPKQAEIDEAIATQDYGFICIGGSRAGGKSSALRPICYRYCLAMDGFRTHFIRRELGQLVKNHTRQAAVEAKRLGAKFSAMTMVFPNDSFLSFDHCAFEDSYTNFVGAEADLIVFDQLEQFTDVQFNEISAATGRAKRDHWRGLVLAGENPGGPLSAFVDELFVSKNRDQAKFPEYDPTQYFFITSNLEDNPYVDPRYISNLAGMGPEKRAMYRWGRRDVFPGQYFRDKLFVQDLGMAIGSPTAHTVTRQGALRWGFLQGGIFLWIVVLPDGRLYVEREWVFDQVVPKDVALTVRALTALAGLTLSNIHGNRDIEDSEGGEDIFETLQQFGLYVQPAKHDPVIGWQRLRHWLRPLDDGRPALIAHPQCETLIRTLPQLIASKTDPEDVDPASPAAAAKALRYFVMSRPTPFTAPAARGFPPESLGALRQQLVKGPQLVLGRHNVEPR